MGVWKAVLVVGFGSEIGALSACNLGGKEVF